MVGYLLFSLSEKVGFQFGQSSSIINQMLSQLTAVGVSIYRRRYSLEWL